jgi:hypothetical protein
VQSIRVRSSFLFHHDDENSNAIPVVTILVKSFHYIMW